MLEGASARTGGSEGREHLLAKLVFVSGIAAICASLRVLLSSAPTSLVWGVHFVLSGFAVVAAEQLLRWLARGRVPRFRLALVGAVWLAAHLFFVAVASYWGESLSPQDFRAGVRALGSGDLPLSTAQLALLLAGTGVLTVAAWGSLVLLERLPRPIWLQVDRLWRLLLTACATLAIVLWLREYIAPRDSPVGRSLGLGIGDNEVPTGASRELTWQGMIEHQLEQISSVAAQKTLGVRAKRTPNLLFVHVESLRWDFFNPELFPKTSRLLAGCWQSPRHYSSGNSTSNAVVGVLTGLSPVYMDGVRRRRLAPQPLRALKELGYLTHVWFPNQTLLFDDLLAGVFGPQVVVHRFEGGERAELDRRLVTTFLRDSSNAEPRFDYVVIDSPHYDYDFPREFERFKPTARLGFAFNPLTGEGANVEAVIPPKTRAGLLNRYRNSLFYVDSLVAQVLERKLVDADTRTWIAVFGDHGEAFWDDGRHFGHRTALSDPQTRVPWLLCGPDLSPASVETEMTSHEDIFPTVFQLMDLEAAVPFMSGHPVWGAGPTRISALLRMPVTGEDASRAYAVVDRSSRVHFQLTDALRIIDVRGADGKAPPSRARAEALVLGSLADASLTVPRLH